MTLCFNMSSWLLKHSNFQFLKKRKSSLQNTRNRHLKTDSFTILENPVLNVCVKFTFIFHCWILPNISHPSNIPLRKYYGILSLLKHPKSEGRSTSSKQRRQFHSALCSGCILLKINKPIKLYKLINNWSWTDDKMIVCLTAMH